MPGQVEPGAQRGQRPGRQARQVDRVLDQLAVERRQRRLRRRQRHAELRLHRRRRQVWRGDDVVQPQEGRAGRRLPLEDVERRPRQPAARQRRGQRRLVHQPAARAVHHVGARLQPRQLARADHPLRLGLQPQVQRQDVGARQEVVERQRVRPDRLGDAGRDVGVVGEHLHPEGARAGGHLAPDPPQPEHAERLVVELVADERLALPAPGLQAGVGARDAPQQRQQQAERVLGGGDRVRPGGIEDHDAPLGRRGHVDVVGAHARARHHPQRPPRGQQVGGHPRLAAHDQRVVARQGAAQLVGREPGAHVDRGLAPQDRQPLLRQRVADQDLVPLHVHLHALCHPPIPRRSPGAAHPLAGRSAKRSNSTPSVPDPPRSYGHTNAPSAWKGARWRVSARLG